MRKKMDDHKRKSSLKSRPKSSPARR